MKIMLYTRASCPEKFKTKLLDAKSGSLFAELPSALAPTISEQFRYKGARVKITGSWNGSYHDASYDMDGVIVVYHKHKGKSRRILREILDKYRVDSCVQRFELRTLVRRGD